MIKRAVLLAVEALRLGGMLALAVADDLLARVSTVHPAEFDDGEEGAW